MSRENKSSVKTHTAGERVSAIDIRQCCEIRLDVIFLILRDNICNIVPAKPACCLESWFLKYVL